MRTRLSDLALGAALGSVASYFLDPDRGRSRRAQTSDRAAGMARRSTARLERAARGVRWRVYGAAQHVAHLREVPKVFDDVTLARKVETELFRPADVPKGQINVNVQDGVVQLRGEVPRPDMIERLVNKARRIQGVREVENLLHLPDTAPQMHQ
jgi:osmotically-inducible protein OsmY